MAFLTIQVANFLKIAEMAIIKIVHLRSFLLKKHPWKYLSKHHNSS